MIVRHVVVQLFSGPVVVHRLRFSAGDQPAWVAEMTDGAVTGNLRRLGVDPIPDTPEERAARLANWPLQSDLDAIATAWTAWNDGVRPAVRVLEATPPLRARGVGGAGGAAGNVPTAAGRTTVR